MARKGLRIAIALLLVGLPLQALGEDPPPLERLWVLDAQGLALPGASLMRAGRTRDELALHKPQSEALALSDEAGMLEVPQAARGAEEVLLVSALGHSPARVPTRGPIASVRLLPALPTQGRLRTETTPGAPGQRVFALPLPGEGEVGHVAQVGDEGEWHFPFLHAGRYRLWLHRQGARWQPLGLIQAGGQAVSPAQDKGSLSGRLLDAEGTRDAAAALVALRLRPLSGGGEVQELRTSESGGFVFAGLAPGVWELELAQEDWELDGVAEHLEVRLDEQREDITIFARARQFVEGTVHDALRQPVANAQVRLWEDPRQARPALPPGGHLPETASAADGRFRLGPVRPGSGYRLSVLAPGHATFLSDPFDVDAGRTTQLKPVRMLPPWVLEVNVRDPDGRPLIGAFAKADAVSRPLDLEGALLREARRSADGTLRLEGLPADDVHVLVGARGYQSVRIEVAHPSTGSARTETVHLLPGAGLQGQVRAAPGGPVAPYALRLIALRGGAQMTTVTSAEGRFGFAGLTPGIYDLIVADAEADGRVLARLRNLSTQDEASLEIDLAAAGAVQAVVQGGEPDGPALEVLLEIRTSTQAHEPESWEQVEKLAVPAAREAEVQLNRLAPGTYGVRVRQGGRISPREILQVQAGVVTTTEIYLLGAGRVAGLVTDSDGRSLLGVAIELKPLDSTSSVEGQSLRAVSDERGDFVLDGVGVGNWLLTAWREGLAPHLRQLEVREGEVLVLEDLMLSGGAELEGIVEDAKGRRVDGARVRLRGTEVGELTRTTRTDGRGRYRLLGIPPGSWELAWLDGLEIRQRVWLELAPDEQRRLDLDTSADGVLRVALSRRGLAVPGASVVAHREATSEEPVEREVSGSTDADGRCEFNDLSAGWWSISVHWGSAEQEHRVFLDEGGEVQLELEVHEALLRGQVVTTDGAAVGGALIEARPLNAAGAGAIGTIHGHADPSGHFVLSGVPVGAYALRAVADGHPPGRLARAEADVAGATFDVEIVLGRGGDLLLTVLDSDGTAVVGARVWMETSTGESLLLRPALTASRGRVRVGGLPEGSVWVRVQATGYGRPRLEKVEILEGELATAQILLHPPGALDLWIDALRLDPVSRVRIDILRVPGGELVARRLPLSRVPVSEPWESLPLTGHVEIPDLEAGEYEIHIQAGPRFEPVRQRVKVTAGQTLAVQIELVER